MAEKRRPIKVRKTSLVGYIERISHEEISGWVKNTEDLEQSLTVELLVEDGLLDVKVADQPRKDLISSDDSFARFGFSFLLEPYTITDANDVQVRVAGTDFSLKILETAGCLEGVVETSDEKNITGWAWQAGYPDRHVEVDVLAGDEFVRSAIANIRRSDLDALGIGHHAFQIDLSDISADKLSGHRRVRFHGTNLLLTDISVTGLSQGSSTTIASGKDNSIKVSPLSALVEYDRGFVSGWVRGYNDGTPEEIEVFVDGAPVWKGFARRLVSDHNAAGEFGFRVLLPPPDTPKLLRTVEVLDSRGLGLVGSPLMANYGDVYIGSVEKIERQGASISVAGWCIDTTRPSEQLEISIFYNGLLVHKGLSDLRREDVSSTGYESPYAGFGFTFEFDGSDGSLNASQFQVRPGNSLTPLYALAAEIDAPSVVMAQRVWEQSLEDDVIEGTIDEVTRQQIRGWARNKNDSSRMVVLDCYIDGTLYATTAAKRFRPDLKKHFGDHGFHEYIFELTPALSLQFPGKIDVVPRSGVNKINKKIDNLVEAYPRKKMILPRSQPLMTSYLLDEKASTSYSPRVAIIVINRDGEALLESFLSSFYKYIKYNNISILIVDHNSSDKSEDIVKKWERKLPVTWHQRGSNYSFSDSNNFGARNSDADLLFFVNNDVTFISDSITPCVQYMSDASIGCLGIRLMDDTPVAPTKPTAIQHLGVHFQSGFRGFVVEAFESRYASIWDGSKDGLVRVPCVTGAFMVCRKDEFLELGGFNERYFYGYEDVDLCLAYKARGQEVVSANAVSALHLRGFSRDKMNQSANHARLRNRNVLDERFGYWFRRELAKSRYVEPALWTSVVPRIAFAVTEASENTLAGDYFTALELASQISASFPCQCVFVEAINDSQYDLAGIDAVIAMRDDFDPRKIRSAPTHILTIAWVRNWFDRFIEREASRYFDMVWSSSVEACEKISLSLGKPVELVPIATNWYRFTAGKPNPRFKSDYCFTGSYWGLNREIVQMLDPAALPFEFAIFGTGWEKVPHLAPFARGSLPYKTMPDVYANTRIVIDDANHVTKKWGAVNSRVYDALAAGALVLTNGASGSQAMFDGELPVYQSPQELEELLWRYLSNEEERQSKVSSLKALVKARHTYQLRARHVWAKLKSVSESQYRISIKIGAPNWKVKDEWGDYHYALSMKYYFEKLGHTVRIDTLDEWYGSRSAGDDVVIVLRGLNEYKPKAHQINIMWNISHSDKVSEAEYLSFDHVYVASSKLAKSLNALLADKVSALLQCTDARHFNTGVSLVEPAPKVLFIGNSRNTLRRIVRDALESELPLEVYGSRWEGFIPDSVIKGQYLANTGIASYYRSAGTLLNDHWDNMAAAGMLSNRLFDAAACGARIVSDRVDGLADVFGDAVKTYSSPEELGAICNQFLSHPELGREEREVLSAVILSQHTFERRVHEILEKIFELEVHKNPTKTGH